MMVGPKLKPIFVRSLTWGNVLTRIFMEWRQCLGKRDVGNGYGEDLDAGQVESTRYPR